MNRKTLAQFFSATALTALPVVRAGIRRNGPYSTPQTMPQNLIQAARALQQINNQIQSLQNEAMMLQNMATNLQIASIRRTLNSMVSALTQISTLDEPGQGIAFNVNATNTAFAQTYPQPYPTADNDHDARADAHASAGRTRWRPSSRRLLSRRRSRRMFRPIRRRCPV